MYYLFYTFANLRKKIIIIKTLDIKYLNVAFFLDSLLLLLEQHCPLLLGKRR
jgi:hypothetical protein